MKNPGLVLVTVILMVATVGCFKHTYQVGAGAPNGEVVYDNWHSHWAFGIVGDETVDISEVCPSGNATIHDEVSFVNGLIAAFIGFVWSPTSVTVTCAKQTTEWNLSRDQAVSIVTDPAFLNLVGDVAPDAVPLAEVAVMRAKAIRAAHP